MSFNRKFSFLVLSLLLIASCDGGVDKSRVKGLWSYSDSECEGDDETVQGATLEIDFQADGDGTRIFTTNSCVVTNEFKWVLDGNKIVTASKTTNCEPASCTLDLEIGNVDFTLGCDQNFEEVWKNSELQLDGNIAVETFKVENLECKNTYINPELQ